MIRITELRLPVNHAPNELETAILKRLSISTKDLVEFSVFKRSHDARKNGAMTLMFTHLLTQAITTLPKHPQSSKSAQ